MLDQILKFIGSFIAIGVPSFIISYDLGEWFGNIYNFYHNQRDLNKEEKKILHWKFRFFTLLVFFSIIFSFLSLIGSSQ